MRRRVAGLSLISVARHGIGLMYATNPYVLPAFANNLLFHLDKIRQLFYLTRTLKRHH